MSEDTVQDRKLKLLSDALLGVSVAFQIIQHEFDPSSSFPIKNKIDTSLEFAVALLTDSCEALIDHGFVDPVGVIGRAEALSEGRVEGVPLKEMILNSLLNEE